MVIDLQELDGLNYIFGTNIDIPNSKNGSGKSSIFVDAIIFALFGRTIKNTNNQYIPNRNCDQNLKSYVKLYFDVDGQEYSSECFCKPKIGTVGMTLLKCINSETNEWDDITQSSVVKTRQYIQDNILGCSFEIFKTSVIVSASDCLNFYEGMNKQAKRNYIENIFNLNCFGIMFSEIKGELNDLKKELTYSNNEAIKVNEQILDLQSKFDSFNDKLNADILELKNNIIEIASNIKYNELQIEKFNTELSGSIDHTEQFNKLNKDLKLFTKKKQELEKQVIRLEYSKKSIQNTLNEVTLLKEGLCEDCIALINKRYDYDVKLTEIQSLDDEENNIRAKIDKLVEYIEKYNDNISSLEESLNKCESVKKKINELTYDNTYLKKDLSKLKTKYDSLKSSTDNPYDELLAKAKSDLEDLKRKTIEFNVHKLHLEVLRDACSENGVKRFIIKDIVKLLNSLIQKYLNEIRSRISCIF